MHNNYKAMKKPKNLGYHILGFFVMTIWGSTFASSKTLINHGMPEVYIFFFRFIIAYLLLISFSHKKIWADNWKDEGLLLLTGLTGGSIYFMAENYGLHYAQTTDVSFIIAFTPLLTTLVAYFFKQERQVITSNFVIGLIIALIGIGFLVFKGNFHMVPSLLGDSLAFLAALLWAIYSLIVKPLGKKYDMFFITRKVFFYGWITILPFLPLFPAESTFMLFKEPIVVANLLFLAVVASFLCYIWWNIVMDKIGVLKSSYYLYVNPVSAAVVSLLFMDEEMNFSIALGLILILAGVIYSEKK